MKKKIFIIYPLKNQFTQIKILLAFLLFTGCSNSYKHLSIISSVKKYKQSILSNPNDSLLEIKKYIPSIVLDIRYATTNNFSGVQVYKYPKAFARKPVVYALKNIQDSLQKIGLGLKIFDAYRPYKVTKLFWKITPHHQKEFVADPTKGSRHNRGCAVDVSIINLKTLHEIEMPTAYDSFDKKSYINNMESSEKAISNRAFLQSLMMNNGFQPLKSEWWHFDFTGWEKYSLMDIPFTQLSK